MEKNIMLSFELSKYIVEHPEFEKKIPNGAEVVILLDDDPEFNRRARKLSQKFKKNARKVVYVKSPGLANFPLSRLIDPVLVRA